MNSPHPYHRERRAGFGFGVLQNIKLLYTIQFRSLFFSIIFLLLLQHTDMILYLYLYHYSIPGTVRIPYSITVSTQYTSYILYILYDKLYLVRIRVKNLFYFFTIRPPRTSLLFWSEVAAGCDLTPSHHFPTSAKELLDEALADVEPFFFYHYHHGFRCLRPSFRKISGCSGSCSCSCSSSPSSSSCAYGYLSENECLGYHFSSEICLANPHSAHWNHL